MKDSDKVRHCIDLLNEAINEFNSNSLNIANKLFKIKSIIRDVINILRGEFDV